MDPNAVDGDPEFEAYLAARRRRRRMVVAGLVLAFVGIVAIPYGLMRAGSMKRDTFEIFVVLDAFVLVGLIRAIKVRVQDTPF